MLFRSTVHERQILSSILSSLLNPRRFRCVEGQGSGEDQGYQNAHGYYLEVSGLVGLPFRIWH